MPSGGVLRRKAWVTNPKPPKSELHFRHSRSRFLCREHGMQPVKRVEGKLMMLACACIRNLAGPIGA
jgi:hypothetical protein